MLLLLIGLTISVNNGYPIIENTSISHFWQEGEAVIVGFNKSKGSIEKTPIFQFQTDNKTYKVNSHFSYDKSTYKLNQKVEILFPLKNPEKAIINTPYEKWEGYIWEFMAGLVLIIIAVERGGNNDEEDEDIKTKSNNLKKSAFAIFKSKVGKICRSLFYFIITIIGWIILKTGLS